MATTTTNFGWEIPQSTDLVKDGATAIAALGQDIDTALVDLKGGTTGQVLAKASGTDLDFSWVAQDDSNAIQNAIVDAKGDLISATAADTPARLAVGTNGHVLTADSTTATGLKWAASASGGMTLLQSLSLSGASTTSSTLSSAYKQFYVLIRNTYGGSLDDITLRLNTDTGSNYSWNLIQGSGATVGGSQSSSSTSYYVGLLNNTTTVLNQTNAAITIARPSDTDNVYINHSLVAKDNSLMRSYIVAGVYNCSAAITSITLLAGGTTFTSGTAEIYGVN